MTTTLFFSGLGERLADPHGTANGVRVNVGKRISTSAGTRSYGVYYGGSDFITASGVLDTVGDSFGIYANGNSASAITITNQGTLSISKYGTGIRVDSSASITNTSTGVIQAGLPIQISTAPGAVGTVVNDGTVASLGYTAITGSASVTNGADGQIFGNIGATGVTNDGTIHGAITAAAGGAVNGSPSNTAARIEGTQSGITTSGTVINFGTLISNGSGAAVESPIAVVNGSSAVTSALISGSNYGVHPVTGGLMPTITNFGTIRAGNFGIIGSNMNLVNGVASAVIRGGNVGVAAGPLSTVTNFGSIVGYGGTSVGLRGGGTITNGVSGSTIGLITGGGLGIYDPKFLTNFGTVAATGTSGAGVVLKSDTTMVNYGVISGTGGSGADGLRDIATAAYNGAGGTIIGGRYGVILYSSGGSLRNAGLIKTTGATAAVVNSSYSAAITNTATGTISGGAFGIFEQGHPGLVANYGLISGVIGVQRPDKLVTGGTIIGTGGTAVSGAGTIVLLPGAVFGGQVVASGGQPLHLGGSGSVGTIAGLGANFIGFPYQVDSGAHWLIQGSNPVGPNVFQISGEADLAGGSIDGSTTANGDFVVDAGGKLFGFGTVSGFGFNLGTVEANGGTLMMSGIFYGNGSFLIDADSAMELPALTGGNARTITFNGAGATLILDNPTGNSGSFAHFSPGDTIDLAGITATGASISGGTLTVTRSGGAPLTYAVPSVGQIAGLVIRPDGATGSDIVAYGLARPGAAAPNPVNFGDRHAGDAASITLSLANGAGDYENLHAGFAGASPGFTVSGSITGLAAGASDAASLAIGLDTSAAGNLAGTAILTLASDGAGLDGNGITPLGAQTIDLSGAVYRLAAAGPLADLDFGNHHVGDVVSLAVPIGNAATADGYSESLIAWIATASPGFSASGSVADLLAGAADGAGLVVTLDTATSGGKSGTAGLTLTSDGTGIDSLGTTALAGTTIALSGGVYRLATPVLADTLSFGAARVGDAAPTTDLAITNGGTADAFQEGLGYALGAPDAGFTVQSGGSGSVASGASDTATLAMSTTTAGNLDGAQIGIGLASSGVGTSGLADTTLAAATITLNGHVYAPAAAQLGAGTIDFGIVHVGDTLAALPLGLSNIASGALTDVLLTTPGAIGDPRFAETVTPGALAAGAATALAYTMSTADAGLFSSSETLQFASHDGELADAVLPSATVALSGTVDNYATAALAKTSGPGVLSWKGNQATLNLGTIAEGSGPLTIGLSVTNSAAGLADMLGGSFALSGAAAFSASGFGGFSGLAGGQADTAPSLTLDTAQGGTLQETVVLTSAGSNASGYAGPDSTQTLTVIGVLAYALTRTPTTITGGPGNDLFIATGGALYGRDIIDGGGGTNTLQLSGAGIFDLRAPQSLANIQAITAQEGQPAFAPPGGTPVGTTRQSIYLRPGMDAGLTVSPGISAPGNPLGQGITIVGAANHASITLSSGYDVVYVGGTGEVVHGGGGMNRIYVTGQTIGAQIDGGGGGSALMVTGGGAARMGNNIKGLASVVLASAAAGVVQPDWVFTANSIPRLQIFGSSGNDTITVGAPTQAVSAGGGTDRVLATAANAGALVIGGGNTTLEITTGGNATLRAGTSNVTVRLDAPTHLVLSRMAFVTALGSSGADTIIADARGQVISGGDGADILVGYAAQGDVFRDTAAGLNGDRILNFGGDDRIEVTDLVPASAVLAYAGTATRGVMTLSDGQGHATRISMVGDFSQSHFHLAPDGHGGTAVTYS